MTENINESNDVVFLDASFTIEISKWMQENIKGSWDHDGISGVIGCSVYFENSEDAIAFKLRWL